MADELAAQFRSAHLEIIEDNPFDCLIKRVEKVRDQHGGFADEDTFVGIVRARLYRAGGSGRYGAREQVTVAGLREEDQGFGLLCSDVMTPVDANTGDVISGDPVTTDLRTGPNVSDTFSKHGEDFSIVSVFRNEDNGETWGFDCIVKRVN